MRYLNYSLVTFGALLSAACGSQGPVSLVEPPAAQFSIAECQTNLGGLQQSTAALTSTSLKDRTGLVGKLDAAAKALGAGKNADAAQKLADYVNKVTTLQAQGKISPGEAAPLLTGAESAIACINSISVPA